MSSKNLRTNLPFKPNHLITDEERIEICRRYATYESQNDIVDWLRKEKGKLTTQPNIHLILHSKRGRYLVETFRTSFLQGLLEEPLSNKRKRLQYLFRQMTKAENKGDFRTAIFAVDKAREEMEPRRDNFQIQLNQFNMLSDEELIELRTSLENKLKPKEIIYAESVGTEVDERSKI